MILNPLNAVDSVLLVDFPSKNLLEREEASLAQEDATREWIRLSRASIPFILSFLSFSSGIVIQQYFEFCASQVESRKRFNFFVATVAVLTNALQGIGEISFLWKTISYSASDEIERAFFWGATLEVAGGSISSLIVQIYFLRLTHTVFEIHKGWLTFTAFLCSSTFLVGCGAVISYFRMSLGFGVSPGALVKMSGVSMNLFVAWLSLSFACDVMTSVGLCLAVNVQKKSAEHKFFRSVLSRLSTITIQIFALNSLAALTGIFLMILPQILPDLGVYREHLLQDFAFTMTAFIGRLYVFSFLFCFKTNKINNNQAKGDSCVASLNQTSECLDRSFARLSRTSSYQEPEPPPRTAELSRYKERRRIPVSRGVQIMVEVLHEKDILKT